jgi:citrate lyase subunit beta/citryl-CoA lyase
MRSYLLAAARDEDLAEALASDADAIVVDLADSLFGAARQRAREVARDFLRGARGTATRLYVRVAPVDCEAIDADLEAILPAAPHGLFLPRACGRADIQRLSAKLAVQEAECGRGDGATRIVALATQTPAAIFALGDYGFASPRLEALALDPEPLRVALGALPEDRTRVAPLSPLALARALLPLGAATARAQAIDAPFANIADEEGLRAECRLARRDGYGAKLALRPSQIRPINEAFTRGGA